MDKPEDRWNYSQVTVISCPRIAGYPLTSNASSFRQPMPHRAMHRFPSCFSTCLANMFMACTCPENVLILGADFDTFWEYVDSVYMFRKFVDFRRIFRHVSPICLRRVHFVKTCRFQEPNSTCFANMLIGCTCSENVLILGVNFDTSPGYVYGVYMFFGRVDSGSGFRHVSRIC